MAVWYVPEKEKSTGTLTTKVIGKEQLCETWVAKLSASFFLWYDINSEENQRIKESKNTSKKQKL